MHNPDQDVGSWCWWSSWLPRDLCGRTVRFEFLRFLPDSWATNDEGMIYSKIEQKDMNSELPEVRDFLPFCWN